MPGQKNDINDALPASLSQVIGQRSVVSQVAVTLDSARADDRKFAHPIFAGGPTKNIAQHLCPQTLESITGFITGFKPVKAPFCRYCCPSVKKEGEVASAVSLATST